MAELRFWIVAEWLSSYVVVAREIEIQTEEERK